MGIWSHRKQIYFISQKRLYEKGLWIFKGTHKKIILKKKNDPVDKEEELKSHQGAKNVILLEKGS